MKLLVTIALLFGQLLGSHAAAMQIEYVPGVRLAKRVSPMDIIDLRPPPMDVRDGPGRGQLAEPESENNSAADECSAEKPVTGNPVVISTGEKLLPQTDFQAGGDYGLGLHRRYRSLNASGTMFGPQWMSNFDYPRLTYDSTTCYRDPSTCLLYTSPSPRDS